VYRAIKGARRRKCVRDVCVRPRVCVCQYSRMRVFNEGIVAINNTCVVCQMNKAWPTQHREGWTDGIAYGMHTIEHKAWWNIYHFYTPCISAKTRDKNPGSRARDRSTAVARSIAACAPEQRRVCQKPASSHRHQAKTAVAPAA
jgi:hypothetical protein